MKFKIRLNILLFLLNFDCMVGFAEENLVGLGKFLGALFAVLCVGASFGGGNAFQSNQATQQITTMFALEGGATKTIIGLIMAAIVGVVIIGGIKRIAQFTEKIVPFMAILYVLASLVIIGYHYDFIDKRFRYYRI